MFIIYACDQDQGVTSYCLQFLICDLRLKTSTIYGLWHDGGNILLM
jgi:hypothetical protein